jgi:hypothetical protein
MNRQPYRPPNVRKHVRDYDAANLQSAKIIMGDIDRYGGPESLMGQWARLILERAEGEPICAAKPLKPPVARVVTTPLPDGGGVVLAAAGARGGDLRNARALRMQPDTTKPVSLARPTGLDSLEPYYKMYRHEQDTTTTGE